MKAFYKEVAQEQDKDKMSILNEIDIMRQYNSYALNKLYKMQETDNSLYMVLNLLEVGQLYDKKKIRINKINLNYKCLYLELDLNNQLLLIVQYSYKILELQQQLFDFDQIKIDLKAENILIRKLRDFYYIIGNNIQSFILLILDQLKAILFNRCDTAGFISSKVNDCKDGKRYDPICDVFNSHESQLFLIKVIMKFLEKSENVRHYMMPVFFRAILIKFMIYQQIDQNKNIALKIKKFDKLRLKQLCNSTLHSPLITISSEIKKRFFK
ncbi:unnamed protein product [Paramecium sonneborni]|uniref:Protein kinase domain-containing protein n=1 Tax=Paramecium sonneborni TaxID=65129 RepID=A0A8S1K785_9CILI|nr:unnamed protein product [Paramecium sonneborni]